MTKRDYILFLVTAVIGLLCGAYVYLTAFAPVYVDDKPADFSSSSFEVVAERYGGCARLGCASVRLTNTRAYQYISPAAAADPAIAPSTGTYPRSEFVALKSIVTKSDLAALSTPDTPTSCASFVDGIDTRYRITVDSEVYELDTCSTVLNAALPLQGVLERVFEVVEDPESFSYNATDFQSAGVIGYLFPQLFQ